MKHMTTLETETSRRDWLKRAGMAGTIFFLIKGLLWIIVPALLAWLGIGN